MGKRQLFKRGHYPWFLHTMTSMWSESGKWWKRHLNKARRRYAKMMIKFGRGKEPVGKESTVNWKDW